MKKRLASALLSKRARNIVHGDRAEAVALGQLQDSELGFAQTDGILQHGLEHWLQFAR